MKRRDFVKKSSAVLAATSVFGTVAAKTLTANNTIQIGVIGTGDRGGGLIPFLNEIEGVNVAACCDVLPFRLQNGLQRAGKNTKSYTNYEDLLADKDIDAVLIATPFATHGKIAIDALNAGKHVYCEKTMTRGYDQIKQMADLAKSSGKIVQTGHQYHSSRLYVEVVKLIEEGKIGKITAFESQWNRNWNWRRPVPDPALERAINWRMYREFSGGLPAELCSHQIDFANWVNKSNPLRVMGMGGIDYWKDGRETYDNVHLMYEYPEGVKATFTCLTSNAKDDYQIKVMGDKGTIILDYTKAWFYPEGTYEGKKVTGDVDGVSGATITNGWEEGKGIPLPFKHADPSKQALMDFRDSILNNEQPISNVITGGKTAISVQMGLDAMHHNKIVNWEDVATL
ncbi:MULTISPECIES: Gfo/Idh/MocA family protein [Galbibacter]|uniref:Gfo/Idh/MocA family oxidoreductase n=1 Tax=Galbibacter pacificus TaxID=2996052 RepID=A0ABT6FV45_9FLAO|nr:Gfo/Idh/MocA family oxidoreductase [Galbibacter pacificus]MDG3583385.1 Gfo/Idh/MocA family oxidoreductase [Galbibacter pacificus]MDG3587138.1 Gfo/Idh/MocA family oxidoreductase [Galbibacter pacificus]